jgi:hypothetical protein
MTPDGHGACVQVLQGAAMGDCAPSVRMEGYSLLCSTGRRLAVCLRHHTYHGCILGYVALDVINIYVIRAVCQMSR